MTKRQHTLLFIFLLPCLLMVGTLCSCDGSYPQELVQADSLLLRGDYHAADSLLAVYDANASTRKSAQKYRELLQMARLFVKEELTDAHFSIVDSLCRYYDHRYTPDEYAQSLCFLGEIYKVSGDYPSALDAFLKGVKVAEDCGNSYVQGWLCKEIGDVYFDQRMLDDCTNYYRKYYDIAINNKDTLRMAYGAFRMGRVYTINDEVDSTLYYYKKAIDLAHHTSNPDNIVPYAKSALTDIYIQIEEYDKARALMPRDSLNDANWAYWHLGQHHTDSALWYLEKIRGRYGEYGERETCLNIARLEASRGNVSKALSYYQVLPAIEDSITMLSQVEETKRVNAQFNFNMIKKERDVMAQRNTVLLGIILIVTMVLILGVTIGCLVWKYYRQKKNTELFQEKLLRKEKEEIYKQSVSQIEENKKKIAELEQRLVDVRLRNDAKTANRIELDTELLTSETKNLEIRQRRREYLLNQLRESSLYIRIMLHAGEEKFRLTDDEWRELAQSIDEVYNDFTYRLLALVELSDIELKVCYLIKIGIVPTAISAMLCKSKTAISMLRKRLYKKITNEVGTPQDLDNLILNF